MPCAPRRQTAGSSVLSAKRRWCEYAQVTYAAAREEYASARNGVVKTTRLNPEGRCSSRTRATRSGSMPASGSNPSVPANIQWRVPTNEMAVRQQVEIRQAVKMGGTGTGRWRRQRGVASRSKARSTCRCVGNQSSATKQACGMNVISVKARRRKGGGGAQVVSRGGPEKYQVSAGV